MSVEPASDKEIAWWRDTLAINPGGLLIVDCDAGVRLLARLDAATAQAAKWERMCHDAQAAKVGERARAETAERKLAAAREALQDIADERGVCEVCGAPAQGGIVSCRAGEERARRCTWAPMDPATRARAALALIDKTGGEG
jgi:hypothetical protein